MYRQILQGERETERMGEGKKKKDKAFNIPFLPVIFSVARPGF